MAQLTCSNGVELTFTVGRMPRADTSRALTWIRQQAGAGATQQRVLSFIQQQPRFAVRQRGARAPITVEITLNLLRLCVAREVIEYRGAVERLVRHEQGHVPAWDRAMQGGLRDICTELGSRITGTVTPNAVARIVSGMVRTWATLCEQAADEWDRQDYPGLHRDLRALGVPTM